MLNAIKWSMILAMAFASGVCTGIYYTEQKYVTSAK